MRYVNLLNLVTVWCILNCTQAVAQTPLACDGKFFVSHSKGSSYSDSTYIDKISFSGGNTNVSAFGNSGSIGVNALGFNPSDGFIYGLQYHEFTAAATRLIKIDATGTFYDLGPISGDFPVIGGNSFAGCFDSSGTYYISEDPQGIGSGHLYSIDIATNTSTLIGPTNILPTNGTNIFLADIAIDPVNGKLYGITNYCCGEISINTSAIFEIDRATGNATWVRQLAPLDTYFGLLFNDDGQLFAYKSNGSLYKVSLTNSDITEVAVGQSFTFADAANCNFRVSNYLSSSASCAGNAANIIFNARINNYSSSIQTGVGYELVLPPAFLFTQPAATIQAALVPLYGAGVTAAISSVSGGTNNKLVLSNMTIAINNISTPSTTFSLNATVNNPSSAYTIVATVTNLPVTLGSTDLSDDPTTDKAEDSTFLDLSSVCTLLPVKLSDFEATAHKNYTALHWTMQAENDLRSIIVERSTDGQSWDAIGTIAPTNSNTETKYAFTDNSPADGSNYYRISFVTINQKIEYSNIKFVEFDLTKKTIAVLPNPSGAFFELQVPGDKDVLYVITDVSGSIVKKGTFKNKVKVYGLSTGVYFAKVNIENKIQTVKIVVQ